MHLGRSPPFIPTRGPAPPTRVIHHRIPAYVAPVPDAVADGDEYDQLPVPDEEMIAVFDRENQRHSESIASSRQPSQETPTAILSRSEQGLLTPAWTHLTETAGRPSFSVPDDEHNESDHSSPSPSPGPVTNAWPAALHPSSAMKAHDLPRQNDKVELSPEDSQQIPSTEKNALVATTLHSLEVSSAENNVISHPGTSTLPSAAVTTTSSAEVRSIPLTVQDKPPQVPAEVDGADSLQAGHGQPCKAFEFDSDAESSDSPTSTSASRLTSKLREGVISDLDRVQELVKEIAKARGLKDRQVWDVLLSHYSGKTGRQGSGNSWNRYRQYFPANQAQELARVFPERPMEGL